MKPPPAHFSLPAVEKLLVALEPLPLPRPLATALVRTHLADLRSRRDPAPFETIVEDLRRQLLVLARSRLQPVLNATGILAHTNLGRAPLAPAAVESIAALAAGYSNLEFDLDSGHRGGRGAYLELALATLCGAESATIVNNCAAALVLVLHHFANGPRREVLVSRGELIQIGGGFRIPEILESSGARLREVGTTNRTTLEDYERALGPETALILRVHRSNFYLEGFVESPTLASLADLARRRAPGYGPQGLPLVEDLGSGALADIASLAPVAPEPSPADSLAAGVDLVCFSGDKLLGGPQAGLIAGRAALVAALKLAPIFRALRCDKLVLAGLQATLEAYLHAAARRDLGPPLSLPVLAMLDVRLEHLRRRADALIRRLVGCSVDAALDTVETRAQIGGGVCPRSSVPSLALRLRPRGQSAAALAARLRVGSPPVIGFVAEDHVHLDLRTVPEPQDERLADAVVAALAPDLP